MAFPKFMRTPLFVRAVGTLLYGAVFVWLVISGGTILLIGISILAVIAAYEFYNMVGHAGYQPFYVVGILSTLLFTVSAYFKFGVFSQTLTLVIVVTFLWAGIKGLFQRKSDFDHDSKLFINWSYTISGAIYSGAFLAHAILIRDLPNGAELLLLVVFGAAACDSAAYLVGTSIGRHQFFQRISPKKTWEGTIGGFVSCLLVVMLLIYLFEIDLSLLMSIILGSLIGLAVIFGDLVESMFKRTSGVKDSGSWIPAQGGLLDVIDGFLIAVVVSYYFYSLVM